MVRQKTQSTYAHPKLKKSKFVRTYSGVWTAVLVQALKVEAYLSSVECEPHRLLHHMWPIDRRELLPQRRRFETVQI